MKRLIKKSNEIGKVISYNIENNIPVFMHDWEDMAKYIENKILTQDLSPSDRALAIQLLEDLYSALGR